MSDYRWDGSMWRHNGERNQDRRAVCQQPLPPAVRVLEKYGMQMPKMDNADYNHCLKVLGPNGWYQKVRMHTSRGIRSPLMLRNGAKIENNTDAWDIRTLRRRKGMRKVLAQSVHEEFDRMAAQMGTAALPQCNKRKQGKGE